MAQVTTISEYLKGVSQLLTDDGLRYVLSKRRLNGDEVLPQFEGETWTDEQGNVSDGGWSHSEGGWTVSKANIDEWMRKYRSLFQKWDEELLDRSRIRIINF